MKAAKVRFAALKKDAENKPDLIQELSDKSTSPEDDTVQANLYSQDEINQSIRLAWDRNLSKSGQRRGSIYTKRKL
jgi:hypothetical protein